MKLSHELFDRGAIGVSLLCMVHCLALPVLALLFPLGIFASLAHNHWHWLFLVLAAPVSWLAVWRTDARTRDRRFVGGVIFGIAMLAAGVVVESHRLQIGLTVLGAASLLAAHILNLRRSLRQAIQSH